MKVNAVFGADTKKFRSELQKVERRLKKTQRNLQNAGRSMSIGFTAPFLLASAAALKNWDKQEKAIAQVEAGLKSTGNTAGKTMSELQAMASDLQKNTLFGDEEILKDATAQLLTFTNIAGEQFDRTQLAALNLATRLDGDLKSASIQLGKALNDPVANLSALSRSGIQFSKDQKKVINALVAGGKQAEAQTIILNELEKQYGGAAKAAAEAGLGPFQQLKNSLGDMTEEFGGLIAKGLLPFVKTVRNIVERVKAMDEGKKRLILRVLGIVAAVGPMLIIFSKLVFVYRKVFVAMKLVQGAFKAGSLVGKAKTLLIVAAVLLLVTAVIMVVKNWDFLVEQFKIGGVKVRNALIDAAKWVSRAMLKMYQPIAKLFGKDLIGASDKFFDSMKKQVPESTKRWKGFKEVFVGLKNESKAALKNMGLITDKAKDLPTGGKKRRPRVGEISPRGDMTAIFNLDTLAAAMLKKARARSKEIRQKGVEGMTASREFVASQTEAWQTFGSTVTIHAQEISAAVASLVGNMAIDLGERLGAVLSGADESFANFGDNMLFSLTAFGKQLGVMMIQLGVAKIAVKALSLPGGGLGAIAAGIALVALSALVKNKLTKGPQGFHEGGRVVQGPGGIDNVPALLTPGETVVSAAGTRNLADKLTRRGGDRIASFMFEGTDMIVSIEDSQDLIDRTRP